MPPLRPAGPGIRDAQAGDAPAVTRLHDGFHPQRNRPPLRSLLLRHLLIARHNGRVVGFLWAHDLEYGVPATTSSTNSTESPATAGTATSAT